MEQKIEIPSKVEYMEIKHVHFMLELTKFKGTEPGANDIARLNALFTGVPLVKMKRFSPRANRNLLNQIMTAVQTYQQSAIPIFLEYPNPDYNKQIHSEDKKTIRYNFIKDFTNLPVDWFQDMDQAVFDENPVDLMAFCFIEDGLEYGHPDGQNNVINPRSKRNEVFLKHVPLNLYLDVQAFFLASWNVLQKLSTETQSNPPS